MTCKQQQVNDIISEEHSDFQNVKNKTLEIDSFLKVVRYWVDVREENFIISLRKIKKKILKYSCFLFYQELNSKIVKK